MQKIANEINNGNLDIFEWDNQLKSYVLNRQGII